MLPKKDRLTCRLDFRQVYKDGRRFHVDPITVFALPARDLKVALVVPKKVGKAVIRNRIKRRLSEAIRLDRVRFDNYHLILKVDKDGLPADFGDLKDLIRKIAKEIYGPGTHSHN